MIKVQNLNKQFKCYHSPFDRLKEIVLQKPFHQTFQALENINFTLNSGETLGIIGKNGAGKSTLLKILSGILIANSGQFSHHGKLTALLELGTGFDLKLTGHQNILANGLLIGMSNNEILEKEENIIEFSELERFIDEPVRNYSSGMLMRLAFAIAIHADPDCFLVDEALSVGDAAFQQKCMFKIREFRKQGGSLLFVSHDLNAIKFICEQVMVLDQGKQVFLGDADTAVNYYNRILSKSSQLIENKLGYGNNQVKIVAAKLVGTQSKTSSISCGEQTKLIIDLYSYQNLDNITIGLMIKDRFGQDVFGTNTFHLGHTIKVKKEQSYQFEFLIKMELYPGKYSITIALHQNENHIEECYHWCDNMISFEIAGIQEQLFSGVCRLSTEFSNNNI